MSESSEAAEQMVKMSLDGVDVGLRLTGKAAKEIAVLSKKKYSHYHS